MLKRWSFVAYLAWKILQQSRSELVIPLQSPPVSKHSRHFRKSRAYACILCFSRLTTTQHVNCLSVTLLTATNEEWTRVKDFYMYSIEWMKMQGKIQVYLHPERKNLILSQFYFSLGREKLFPFVKFAETVARFLFFFKDPSHSFLQFNILMYF